MPFFRENTVRIVPNLLKAVFFGLVSLLFGLVQFNLPILQGVDSSLNEIPILVSTLYLSNPIYLVVVAIVSGIGNFDTLNILSITVHLVALLAFWLYYQRYLQKARENNAKLVLLAILGVIGYYLILIVPLVFIATSNRANSDGALTISFALMKSVSFETIATTLVIILYLLQNNANKKLKEYLRTLEDKVKERTVELDQTIEKLNYANEELKSNNESLDLMVTDRTAELENRNIQLTGYAFINSHLLRAPLARILGLSNLIKHQLDHIDDQDLIDKFIIACQELDEVINLLSEFLSEESVLSKKQLDELQKRIMQIATEIKEIER